MEGKYAWEDYRSFLCNCCWCRPNDQSLVYCIDPLNHVLDEKDESQVCYKNTHYKPFYKKKAVMRIFFTIYILAHLKVFANMYIIQNVILVQDWRDEHNKVDPMWLKIGIIHAITWLFIDLSLLTNLWTTVAGVGNAMRIDPSWISIFSALSLPRRKRITVYN